MIFFAILTGLAASALLLAAGYLAGLRHGSVERDRLRLLLAEYQREDGEEGDLKATIQEVLGPLVERERISLDLAQVPSSGSRRDLSPLLDAIVTIGGFASVVLSNDEGLPLAASPPSADQDRILAASTRLFIVIDRIAGMRPPQSILIGHVDGATTLCRMFRVRDQRMLLTAASNDPRLSSSALDPALARIETALLEE